jgi:hypothetical protein
MELPASWPPVRGDFFRQASLHRPVFQGDLFTGVPIVKARSGGSFATDPSVSIERRTVALLGFPCDVYSGGVLGKAQMVAVVREARKLGVPENWEGAFTACPLPDPFGDGVLWSVDFLTLSPVDRSYLKPENRIACLSEFGWAFFRQRLALCLTRTMIPLDPLEAVGKATWQEIEMWENWNSRGHDPDAFQKWLDGFDVKIGFTRRTALSRGLGQMVATLLP